jgi:hypothetical protein
MNRVVAYVDGFNLYYGLKSGYGRRYHWLDLQRLASSLLRPGQELRAVHYFTARAYGNSDGERRQVETDVNIAIAMLEGAVQDDYDSAILISGDGDLRPAVAAVKRVTPRKRVIAAGNSGP